jgi:hypothetical protein
MLGLPPAGPKSRRGERVALKEAVECLREAIFEELRWMRANQLGNQSNPSGILDDADHGWKKGQKESAYATHFLRIESGPLQDNGGALDVQLDAPPFLGSSCSASGQHTTGSVTYEFKLVVPGAVTDALLDVALEERTRLIRWDGDSLSEWAPTYFNTDTTSGDITVSGRNPMANPPNVEFELTLSVPAPGADERFKYVLVTWDAYGQWDQDTTVQEGD